MVEEHAPTDEPVVMLGVAIALHHNILRVSDEVLDEFIGRARRGGVTWERIGAALGITRQAAHARFADRVPTGRWVKRFSWHWSQDARRVLVAAMHVVQATGADEVDVAHLLIGLTRTPGPVADLLGDSGVTSEQLLEHAPTGSADASDPRPWSAATQALFDVADAACSDEQDVTPLHLLIGALEAETSPAPEILQSVGADPDVLRAEVQRRMQ